MSLSIITADSGRSTTAAALIDDVAAKRIVVVDLKKKLKGHKSEEKNMTADLRSSIMKKTDLGHDILDLRAFVKDDPNDKKAKKKLAKLEAKLQVQLQLAMNKRTGLKAVIAATEEDLIRAEAALRTAVEAKLAYRRQLLSDDSSGSESSDEESDRVGDNDVTFGNVGNGGVGGDIRPRDSVLRSTDLSCVSLGLEQRLQSISVATSPDSSAGQNGFDADAAFAPPSARRIAPVGTRRSGRAAKQPVSYEEPSLNAKVRKGHHFFPK